MPASACESAPPVADVESVVGLTLEEPLELLGICSFSSDDPSEFVEFSLRDADSCRTGRPYDEQGELDGIPYGLVSGRLALVEICTPDNVLAVSVNTRDGDNGPVALELMTSWLAALSS